MYQLRHTFAIRLAHPARVPGGIPGLPHPPADRRLVHAPVPARPPLGPTGSANAGGRMPAMDGDTQESDQAAWIDEFEAAARRPLPVRVRYAFIKTYRPVLDDEPFRAFDRMEDYRAWCEAALPTWLGYGRV